MSDIVGWYAFFAIVTAFVLSGGIVAAMEVMEQRETYGRVASNDDER